MKEQNILHLAGWLLEYEERTEYVGGTPGYILEATFRSDRRFFGGHHRVWFLNWTGLEARTYLDVFARHVCCYSVDDIESLSRETLSQRFLKVVFSGWLCGNVPVADSVTYLNLTEQMRREAKQQLVQLEEQIHNEAWPESTKVASKVMMELSQHMKAS